MISPRRSRRASQSFVSGLLCACLSVWALAALLFVGGRIGPTSARGDGKPGTGSNPARKLGEQLERQGVGRKEAAERGATQPVSQPPQPSSPDQQQASASQPASPASVLAPELTAGNERLSGRGPRLSDAELRGGWQLSREVYDRALVSPNVTVLSRDHPRVLLVSHLLSPDEINHVVELAQGDMTRSEVVADGSSMHDARTSYGSWLNGRKRDDLVRELQHRIHSLVGIPEAFGESIYVLRYAHGQRYEPHTDHCSTARGQPGTPSCREFLARSGGPGCGPGAGGATCGDRLATLILFLRSPARGGATVFPLAKPWRPGQGAVGQRASGGGSTAGGGTARAGGTLRDGVAPVYHPQAPDPAVLHQTAPPLKQQPLPRELAEGGGAAPGAPQAPSLGAASSRGSKAVLPWYCEDGADVLQVMPQPGSALLFWDYVPDAKRGGAVPDPTSLHGGCPVLEGEKLIATRWIRSSHFQ